MEKFPVLFKITKNKPEKIELNEHKIVQLINAEGQTILSDRTITVKDAIDYAQLIRKDLKYLKDGLLKIAEFDKELYLLKKRKPSATIKSKEIQINFNITRHDLDRKVSQAMKLLEQHNVKLLLKFKSRQLQFMHSGYTVLENIVNKIYGGIYKPTIIQEANNLTVLLQNSTYKAIRAKKEEKAKSKGIGISENLINVAQMLTQEAIAAQAVDDELLSIQAISINSPHVITFYKLFANEDITLNEVAANISSFIADGSNTRRILPTIPIEVKINSAINCIVFLRNYRINNENLTFYYNLFTMLDLFTVDITNLNNSIFNIHSPTKTRASNNRWTLMKVFSNKLESEMLQNNLHDYFLDDLRLPSSYITLPLFQRICSILIRAEYNLTTIQYNKLRVLCGLITFFLDESATHIISCRTHFNGNITIATIESGAFGFFRYAILEILNRIYESIVNRGLVDDLRNQLIIDVMPEPPGDLSRDSLLDEILFLNTHETVIRNYSNILFSNDASLGRLDMQTLNSPITIPTTENEESNV